MKDKQTKAAVVQWLVPSIVLVIVVIVMLFNFSAKSSQSAAAEVENSVINVAEKYAAKVNYELLCMSSAGKPIAYILEKYSNPNFSYTTEMTKTLYSKSDAYAVVFCDEKGKGIRHDSFMVDLNDCSYYDEIFSEKQDTASGKEDVTETMEFIYVQEDEIGIGKEAIIAVISLKGINKLLMYYPIEEMQGIFKKTEFDAGAFYSIVDVDGNIFETAGVENNFTKGGNLWSAIKLDAQYADSVSRAIVRMKNRTTGSFSAVVDGEARRIVYAPIGINNWAVVLGINQSYIDNLQSREWSNTKQMIYQLVVAIMIFLGMVVVINIIGKIKSSERSKALEQKADTDLLTGLSNKLATERKIKEYMGNHPNESAMMFILDIDNFKKINDTLGHSFGDEVLRSLGHQIGAIFRATDIVGRTGGDEFTIFVKHLNDNQLYAKEAEKLCHFFKNFQAGEYVKYAATASIGAAVFPRDGKEFESLYKAADAALYMAKKRGKNQLAFYGDEKDKMECKKKIEEEN